MRIYLDVRALSRPFDDQSQVRVRVESEAVRVIPQLLQSGENMWVTSVAVEAETAQDPSAERRCKVQDLLSAAKERVALDAAAAARARTLASQGLAAFDA